MNRTLLQRLLATLRRWDDNRRAIQALSGLDDRVLRDIGIDRNQIVYLVRGRLGEVASEPEHQIQTTGPAQAPRPEARPYPARPAGIHGPAARHWPQAFRDATGANDEMTPGKAAEQTC